MPVSTKKSKVASVMRRMGLPAFTGETSTEAQTSSHLAVTDSTRSISENMQDELELDRILGTFLVGFDHSYLY